MTRLIRQYRSEGVAEAAAHRRRRFSGQVHGGGHCGLAEVDRAHEWLSGPATRHILKREYEEFVRANAANGVVVP